MKQYIRFLLAPLENEKASVLLASLLTLSVLTIIGIAATNTSNMDTMIANAEKNMQQAFFAAEAGLEHGKAILTGRYRELNQISIATGNIQDWDFAINGSETGISAATDGDPDTIDDDDGNGDYEGGAVWLCKSVIDSKCSYTVTIWNNEDEMTDGADDGNELTDDEDGRIFLRSDGFGPNGARSAVQILLVRGLNEAKNLGQGYDAQSGGGQGKNSTGTLDKQAVTYDGTANTRQL